LGVTIEVLLVNIAWEDLDVSTSAVNLLLVLHSVLENEVLLLVGERGELSSVGIKASVLGGLDTLVGLGITIELASGEDKVSTGALSGFEVGLDPPVGPVTFKTLH
jgi:hypothetical protein